MPIPLALTKLRCLRLVRELEQIAYLLHQHLTNLRRRCEEELPAALRQRVIEREQSEASTASPSLTIVLISLLRAES
jgi:type VI protein secretion system component VasF